MGDREAVDPTVEGAAAGGGTQDTPDETLFAALVYVLVSGCAWRRLPPCFGSALEEARSDLDAARAANRDLTRALNQQS